MNHEATHKDVAAGIHIFFDRERAVTRACNMFIRSLFTTANTNGISTIPVSK